MKKWVLFFVLIFSLLSRSEGYAAPLGTSAVEGSNATLKWSVFGSFLALTGTVFGLIYKTSASDPALFEAVTNHCDLYCTSYCYHALCSDPGCWSCVLVCFGTDCGHQ